MVVRTLSGAELGVLLGGHFGMIDPKDVCSGVQELGSRFGQYGGVGQVSIICMYSKTHDLSS